MKNPPLKSVSLFWQHHASFEMDQVHLLTHLTALSKPGKKRLHYHDATIKKNDKFSGNTIHEQSQIVLLMYKSVVNYFYISLP